MNQTDQKVLRTCLNQTIQLLNLHYKCRCVDLFTVWPNPSRCQNQNNSSEEKKSAKIVSFPFVYMTCDFFLFFFKHLCRLDNLLSAVVSASVWQCLTLRSTANTERTLLVYNLQLSVNSSHTVMCASSCNTSSLAGRCATALDSRRRFEPHCAAWVC